MEAIWEDLSNEEEQIESPDWHKKGYTGNRTSA